MNRPPLGRTPAASSAPSGGKRLYLPHPAPAKRSMTRLSREAEEPPPDPAAMGLVRAVSQTKATHDADIFWFSARITRESVQCLLAEFGKAERRDNCILILCTFGGDPE